LAVIDIFTTSMSNNNELLQIKKFISRNEYSEKRMHLSHAMTLVPSTGNQFKREALAMKKLDELTTEKLMIKNRVKQLLYLDMQKSL
jgi:hypothetical protein